MHMFYFNSVDKWFKNSRGVSDMFLAVCIHVHVLTASLIQHAMPIFLLLCNQVMGQESLQTQSCAITQL